MYYDQMHTTETSVWQSIFAICASRATRLDVKGCIIKMALIAVTRMSAVLEMQCGNIRPRPLTVVKLCYTTLPLCIVAACCIIYIHNIYKCMGNEGCSEKDKLFKKEYNQLNQYYLRCSIITCFSCF